VVKQFHPSLKEHVTTLAGARTAASTLGRNFIRLQKYIGFPFIYRSHWIYVLHLYVPLTGPPFQFISTYTRYYASSPSLAVARTHTAHATPESLRSPVAHLAHMKMRLPHRYATCSSERSASLSQTQMRPEFGAPRRGFNDPIHPAYCCVLITFWLPSLLLSTFEYLPLQTPAIHTCLLTNSK